MTGESKHFLKHFSKEQLFLIAMPIILLGSTYLAFQLFVELMGLKKGYLMGFIFYWAVWGIAIPIILCKFKGTLSLFRSPIKNKHTWLNILLLIIPCILAILGGPFLQRVHNANLLIWIVSFIIAVVNALAEEIIWRGLYIKFFEGSFFALIYPIIGFAIWHISPNSVNPSSFGVPLFVLFSGIVGVFWGLVAYRTKTIRWTFISHIIVDFSGLIGIFYLT